MKRTLHILFAAFAAMILLPAAMMAQDAEGIRYSITDGTLTIGGSGPMDNYGTYGECPWYESIVYGDDGVIEVTEIIIEKGITHIGDYAFEDANAVTSVTLPSTLESIGMHAFAFMSSLTEITIPKNVAFIDELAFTNCDNLCSITLTSSAAPELGDQAFGGCEKLKAIYVNGAPDDYMDWTGTYEYPVSLNTSEASLEIADAEFDVKDYIIGIKNLISKCRRDSSSTCKNPSRFLPALPTKGRPCRDSCSPGASPMSITGGISCLSGVISAVMNTTR